MARNVVVTRNNTAHLAESIMMKTGGITVRGVTKGTRNPSIRGRIQGVGVSGAIQDGLHGGQKEHSRGFGPLEPAMVSSKPA